MRLLSALAVVACCLWLAWVAVTAGASRLLSTYGVRSGVHEAAEEAVRLASSDAEAHGARAALLSAAGRTADAVEACERALALRPRDYALWLDLGRLREEAGDVEGALAAFREAVRWAPFYAQPHWQLGNALLRARGRDGAANAARLEEAFSELRRASLSNPALFANLVGLSWSLAGGEPQTVVQLLQPEAPAEKLALARALAKRGHADEAVKLYEQAGEVGEKERRALLSDLLDSKQFAQAYRVWSGFNYDGGSRGAEAAAGVITDGGFEGEIRLDSLGFGWQLSPDRRGWGASLDPNGGHPRGGARSIRLDFTGESNPSTRLLTQLVLVEPGARYRLTFAARTEKIVSAGLPQIAVFDAVSKGEPLLAKSEALPTDSNGWRDYAFEFRVPKNINAVRVVLQREACAGGQCPVFGSLWLDDFALDRADP